MILFVLFCAFDRLDEVKIFLHLPLKPKDACTLLLPPWLTSWMKSVLLFQNDWLTYILHSIYHLWETVEIIFLFSSFSVLCWKRFVPPPAWYHYRYHHHHHHHHQYTTTTTTTTITTTIALITAVFHSDAFSSATATSHHFHHSHHNYRHYCHCCFTTAAMSSATALLDGRYMVKWAMPMLWGKTFPLTMKISTQVYVHFNFSVIPADPNVAQPIT